MENQPPQNPVEDINLAHDMTNDSNVARSRAAHFRDRLADLDASKMPSVYGYTDDTPPTDQAVTFERESVERSIKAFDAVAEVKEEAVRNRELLGDQVDDLGDVAVRGSTVEHYDQEQQTQPEEDTRVHDPERGEENHSTEQATDRVASSIKSRTEKPAIYPERFPVPDDKAAWNTGYSYAPDYFVADVVIDNDSTVKPGGWADPEDIDKLDRELHSYVGEVQFDDQGHPRNPYTRTGLKGRGLLGKWGANFAADPIISRVNPETGAFEIVVIERSDTHEWAIPGGMVDEGEDVSLTVEREFREEAGASVDMSGAELVYQGYVDDPRNTDNAWMETTAKHLHLDNELAAQISLEAGDDAKAVRWLDVNPEALGNLYASHGPMIRRAIELFLARPNVEISSEMRAKLSDALHVA